MSCSTAISTRLGLRFLWEAALCRLRELPVIYSYLNSKTRSLIRLMGHNFRYKIGHKSIVISIHYSTSVRPFFRTEIISSSCCWRNKDTFCRQITCRLWISQFQQCSSSSLLYLQLIFLYYYWVLALMHPRHLMALCFLTSRNAGCFQYVHQPRTEIWGYLLVHAHLAI